MQYSSEETVPKKRFLLRAIIIQIKNKKYNSRMQPGGVCVNRCNTVNDDSVVCSFVNIHS